MGLRILYPGDTRHISLEIKDPLSGNGFYNLAAASAVEIVIGNCEDGTQHTVSVNATQVTLGNPALGKCLLTLLPSATATLPEGKYQLRIRVVEADGDRYTVYTETVTVPCALPATV
jgi:hypothetical protein